MNGVQKVLRILAVSAGVLLLGQPVQAFFHTPRVPRPVVATPDVGDLLRRQQEAAERLRQQAQERAEEARVRAEQQRAEIEARRKTFEEEVKKRLTAHQQEVALRLAANLNAFNVRRGELYEHHLALLRRVLDHIEAHANFLEAHGAKVSDVRAAVATARGKIAAAEVAVDAQQAKEYVVDISGGGKIGPALRAAVDQWHSDHQALHQGPLREAREAVRVALHELGEAAQTVSPSPPPSPSTIPSPAASASVSVSVTGSGVSVNVQGGAGP